MNDTDGLDIKKEGHPRCLSAVPVDIEKMLALIEADEADK